MQRAQHQRGQGKKLLIVNTGLLMHLRLIVFALIVPKISLSYKMAQNECFTQGLCPCSQYNSVLTEITMDLYSLFAHILAQDEDEDPVDPIPTNDYNDFQPGCMIQWIVRRLLQALWWFNESNPVSSMVYRGEHPFLLSTPLT